MTLASTGAQARSVAIASARKSVSSDSVASAWLTSDSDAISISSSIRARLLGGEPLVGGPLEPEGGRDDEQRDDDRAEDAPDPRRE